MAMIVALTTVYDMALASQDKVMGEPDSAFGYSIAAAGDVVAIGAPSEDGGATDSGAVHVYQRSEGSWTLQQSIQPDSGEFAEFGSAVALDEDVLAVGAWGDSSLGEYAGAVYVYRFDGVTWFPEAEIRPSDGEAWDSFGASVALSGKMLLIGVPGDSDSGSDAGSVYVYRYQDGTWTKTDKLLPADVAAQDLFGWSLAFDGTTAVVGAWADDDRGNEAGAAYVFRYENFAWSEQQKLTASDGGAFHMFGAAVAVDNGAVAIGSYLHQHGPSVAGAAYVFRYDGTSWVEESEFAPESPVDWGLFGHAVAIEGDRVLIGYPGDPANGPNSGSGHMYWFDGTSWQLEDSVTPNDGQTNAMCGWAVDLSENLAALGAWEDDNGNGSDAGAVYLTDVYPLPRKLMADDGQPGDHFGNDVALYADWAVVGARRVSDQGPRSGAAYVFRHAGDKIWRQQQKLIPSDATDQDVAGYTVDISGTAIIVGARLHDEPPYFNTGAAYVYEFDGVQWAEAAKLVEPDRMPGDQFGCSAGVDEATAVVGAMNYGAEQEGAAFVFERQLAAGWSNTATLLPDQPGGHFGVAVDIAGDVIVIGSEWDDDLGADAGAAYVFRRTGSQWSRESKLRDSTGGSVGDNFGCATAVDGQRIVIGSRWHDAGGLDAGAAYVYNYSGGIWSLEAKLLADDADAGDEFGFSVAVYGDTVIVGSASDDDNGAASGSVYVFRFDGSDWIQAAKLAPPDGVGLAQFGCAVSVWGGSTLVGAYGDSAGGTESGAAYMYGDAILSTVSEEWPCNRHRYQRFAGDADWDSAAAMASQMSYLGRAGHLVTITRQEEQEFIIGNLGQDEVRRHWLGGFQPDPGSLPNEGWQWVSGEPWAYTNWSDGEPNDFAGIEDVLSFSNDYSEPAGGWNDTAREVVRPGFIVEFPPFCPPDVNEDGLVNTQDVVAFLNAFVADRCEADYDGDGRRNSHDVISFLNDFVSGC